MRPIPMWCCLTSTLVLCARLAGAVAVDGSLDPDYGAPLSTQTTQTRLGDSPANYLNGSELDGAFGYVADDTLHLLITGSFNRFYSEPLSFANQLQLYIDTAPGGQNPLGGANPSVGYVVNLQRMVGLGFDADFAPDYWLAAARDGGGGSLLFAYYAALPAGGGGAGHFLGTSSVGGTGSLSGTGSSNPFGILACLDASNAAGVTAGCEAASGAGVTTGIEWAVPLAAIGNPTGQLRICALLASSGAGGVGLVSNQLLGPVPPGTCGLGPASGVQLQSVPGSQYFVIDVPTSVARTSWGRLKSAYR